MRVAVWGTVLGLLVLLLLSCTDGPASVADNELPTVQDLAVDVQEDEEARIDLLAGATDPDGDSLEVVSYTEPHHGAVSRDGTALRYTPTADYHGPDAFDVTVGDGRGGTAVGTVVLTVLPVQDVPVAAEDTLEATEDTPTLLSVLTNDVDADGDDLRVEVVEAPGHGTAEVQTSFVMYSPPPDYDGPDSLRYAITDPEGLADTAWVRLTVLPVNDPPVLADDSVSVPEDETVTIDVLANDGDPDGDALEIEGVSTTVKATVTVGVTELLYAPNEDVCGSDAFRYFATDGQGGVDTAMVHVAITCVNDPPVAVDDSAVTNENVPVLIDVLANDTDVDGDSLMIAELAQPDSGSAVLEGTRIRYTPVPTFYGTDQFTYVVSDGNGTTDLGYVNISVNLVNAAPTPSPDSGMVQQGSSQLINVLANDTDPDGDALTLTAVFPEQAGSATIEANQVRYAPDPAFWGLEKIGYEVIDLWDGARDTLTVYVNGAPVGGSDAVSGDEDAVLMVQVLSNDSDPDPTGAPLEITGFTQGGHGTVTRVEGRLDYTPAPGWYGTDTFTYDIVDDRGGTDLGIEVAVTVNAVNDPPVASNDAASVNEDATVLIDVLANDTDPESDPLQITQVLGADLFATAAIEGGQIRYTPHPDVNRDNSTHQFRYVASDGRGGLDTAWVHVDVAPVDDPAVAVADAATVDEDGTVLIGVLYNDPNADWGVDVLTITGFTQGTNGTVAQEDDRVRYTPDANWNGTDRFTYTMTDGITADSATVTITVNPVNDTPVAVEDSATVAEDGSVLIDVMANDYDVDGYPIFVAYVHDVQNGTADVTSGGAAVQFTPTSDYHGTTSFRYIVADASHGASDTATVTVTVTSVPDAPVVKDSTYAILPDQTAYVDTYLLFSDADNDSGRLESFTQPANGAVTQEGDAVRYTPPPGWTGTATFTVTMHDGTGLTASATGTITVLVAP